MVFGHTKAVRSHRTGRRRKRGGSRLPVAPWILITLVCVLVASALTAGFVTLLRAGCSGDTYRVSVAVAPNVRGAMEDLAREWEAQGPEIDGECVGVEINEVSPVAAAGDLIGEWNSVALGKRPIAWVPDSSVWPEWVAGSEVTAGYFASDPVVLGESRTVLAVPEPTAETLGWLGGQPPSWEAVLEASGSGSLTLAAANPRSSTEGMQSMLNAVSDGAGGVDAGAMQAYGEALDAGLVAESAAGLFSELAAAEDPLGFADAFTALDYQVAEFNAGSGLDFELVPIVPAGADVHAQYRYQVLDGAGWVSSGDAAVAGLFGSFLSGAGAGALADAGVSPVEEGSESVVTGETVRSAVRQWQSMRRDLHLLLVVDRSDSGAASVEYDGESVEAAVAAVRAGLGLVDELGSTSTAGLWEFGAGAGGGDPWRSLVDSGEMSQDHRSSLSSALNTVSTEALYPGGSPLFDTVLAAQDYMGDRFVEGASNVVVVLTNDGTDPLSAPSVEETAAALGESAAGVPLVMVGFGDADAGNLSLLAEATGGAYVPAPSSGGLLGQVREQLVN